MISCGNWVLSKSYKNDVEANAVTIDNGIIHHNAKVFFLFIWWHKYTRVILTKHHNQFSLLSFVSDTRLTQFRYQPNGAYNQIFYKKRPIWYGINTSWRDVTHKWMWWRKYQIVPCGKRAIQLIIDLLRQSINSCIKKQYRKITENYLISHISQFNGHRRDRLRWFHLRISHSITTIGWLQNRFGIPWSQGGKPQTRQGSILLRMLSLLQLNQYWILIVIQLNLC